MSNNNNNRASERKNGGGGNGGPALNGHHLSQPQARSYFPFQAASSQPIQQGTMSPSQLLTNSYHQPMGSAAVSSLQSSLSDAAV